MTVSVFDPQSTAYASRYQQEVMYDYANMLHAHRNATHAAVEKQREGRHRKARRAREKKGRV